MSATLPDDVSGGAPAPGRTTTALWDDGPVRFLRRMATRTAWFEHPVVHLRYVPADDALLVDVLPLPPASDRVVAERLCIEFDGDDREALPTTVCLTGFTRSPSSAAAKCARHLLGGTLYDAAIAMVRDGEDDREIHLLDSVRDSRVRTWRRLTGLVIGIEILPGELRAALVGADGEVIEREHRAQAAMDPVSVTAGIAAIARDVQAAYRALIAGTPVHLGVQIGGPVDPSTGVVHHFHKSDRAGRPGYRWQEVPLAEMIEEATGMRAHVLNDVAGYASYDRWFYPSPGERCRAVLLISQGIGAKLIINGDVAVRMPMEIGNFILHENGAPCECGNRGCLEATAGLRAIVERVQSLAGRPTDDIEHAVEQAEPSGPTSDLATEVFRTAGRDLARGIGIVQAIVNPSSWAIYGPACLVTKGGRASDAFLGSLEDFDQWVAYDAYQDCVVRRRPIEGNEGAHGAALVALERFGIASPGSAPAERLPG